MKRPNFEPGTQFVPREGNRIMAVDSNGKLWLIDPDNEEIRQVKIVNEDNTYEL